MTTHFLPRTLRNLHLYEDSNQILHDGQNRHADPSLGVALSEASHDLEHLSAFFLIDAKDFFSKYLQQSDDDDGAWDVSRPKNERPWTNLRTLALTSRFFHWKHKPQIKRLLVAAALAARSMPKLRVMEIWNSADNQACIFRYNRRGKQPEITWGSSWRTDLNLTKVMKAWRRVDTKRELLVTKKFISGGMQQRTVEAQLLLRKRVLHPVSNYQLFWEAGLPGTLLT